MASRTFFLLGSISAFSGVAMGAFGAHALRSELVPRMLEIYQTAVDYQMWHALGLVMIGMLMRFNNGSKLLGWAGWLMFIGIVVFSGSLYTLSITGIRWIGAITPFGGVSLLVAWLLMARFSIKSM